MKLQHILDQLQYGALQHVKLGGDRGKGIDHNDYPMLIANINLALIELHTVLPLRVEHVLVEQHKEISTYLLDTKYAASDSNMTGTTKYILDSISDPFIDNVTFIDEVKNAECGTPFILRNADECTSLHTPIFNAITVPTPTDGVKMSVKYRTTHPYLEPTAISLGVDVDIPLALLPVLTMYVKFMVYSNLPTLDSLQLAQTTYQIYTAEIQRIKDEGIIKEFIYNNKGLERKQWA